MQELIGPRFRRAAVPYRGERTIAYIDSDRSIPRRKQRQCRQAGGHVDRVITAEQAGAYKPSTKIFHHAWSSLGIGINDLLHVCASPHLDLAAARELRFRTVWVDRGAGRKPLADYQPNEIVPTLDKVPAVLAAAGWM